MIDPGETYVPPYRWAVVAGLAVFALYVATLAPTTAMWDASEYITTAWILGIPHPPGNPLFVVVGRVWALLLAPLGLPVAVRVNLLAAATSAVASGFFFLVAHRVLVAVVPRPWMARVGAAASTLIGATAYTVWNQSTVNEKVYTLSVLVLAAATWLAVRWYDRRDEPGSLRYPLAAVYLLALGSTNHLMSVLPAPALAVFALVAGPAFLLRRAFWVRAVPLVLLGLSFNFFLPVRAAEDPIINEGDPTCESFAGAAGAVYTNGRAGCAALASSLAREQYSKPPLTERQAPAGHQLLNYYQWFDWQWARGLEPSEAPMGPRLPVTLLFLALGLAGLWATWKADRVLFAYLGTLVGVLTVGLVFYLNFRHGYSLPPTGPGADHEVRERDYFFVASFMVWGVVAGIGLTWAWGAVGSALASSRRWALSSPVLLVAAVPLVLNWGWAGRRADWAARDWAYDLLMSVEPYGVLFTNGDNDTFPLWYVQEVEGVRRDVTVIVGQYLFTTWYPKQLARLTEPCPEGVDPLDTPTVIVCQRPFDPDDAPFYDAPPPPPESILTVDPSALDRVESGAVPEDVTVEFPTLAVTYPGGTFLDRSERLALAIIRDTLGERPVYFSSGGALIDQIGMGRWGVRQGLVTKLEMRPPGTEPDPGWVQASAPMGGEWFDYERSMRLYEDVYRFRGLRDRDVWFDRATLNIPWHFYALSLQLADLARQRGEPAETVERFEAAADAFAVVAGGGAEGTPRGAGLQ